MSELVEHKADVTIPVYGTIADAEVYLKAEADKVIAYHKYKRCLAMAMWCDSEANYWYDSSKVQQCCRYGHYISWFNKWSKLAEKFKQGLVIGVDEATGTDKTVVINYKEAK